MKILENLSEAMGEMAEAPIFIDDTPGLSVLEMRTKARRAVAQSAAWTDYCRLLATDASKRQSQWQPCTRGE